MHTIKKWFWIVLFFIIPFPWIYMRFFMSHGESTHTALISGAAIISAAFLLSWIAEVSQKDIPQSLALAAVALIAVLPEYAVDMYFAWMAGKNPDYSQFALANMTGGNRLLVGAGWAFVIFLFYIKTKNKSVTLSRENGMEISSLIMASLYALLIPLKGNLSLIDGGFFILLFGFYIWKATKLGIHEPEIEGGPQQALSDLPDKARRIALLILFFFSGFVIFISAEPFAESLIATGRQFKIDEFLLVQWIAPLASEAPEFIVAGLFAFHGNPTAGMGCLISSKVNQWTLLVGMLPLVLSISAGSISHLTLDPRQTEEIFLTIAQSLFATAIISKMKITVTDAFLLFSLFITQLFITHELTRWIYAGVYCLLGALLIFTDKERRTNIRMFWQDFFKIPSYVKNGE